MIRRALTVTVGELEELLLIDWLEAEVEVGRSVLPLR